MNTKNFIILILVGIIAGLIIFGTHKSTPPAPVLPITKDQAQSVVKNEDAYRKRFDSLQIKYSTLEKKTDTLKSKLTNEKARARMMEKFINDLPVPYEQKNAINDYVQNEQSKDSTTDDLLIIMEDQSDLKDSMLAAKDLLYSKLRVTFDSSLAAQQALIDYSKQLRRQLKWKKVGNTIWKSAAVGAGLIILKNALK